VTKTLAYNKTSYLQTQKGFQHSTLKKREPEPSPINVCQPIPNHDKLNQKLTLSRSEDSLKDALTRDTLHTRQ